MKKDLSQSWTLHNTIHMGTNVKFPPPPSSAPANTNRHSDPVYLEHMPHLTTGGSISKAAPTLAHSHSKAVSWFLIDWL